MTIHSAAEFARLRRSDDPGEQARATHEHASNEVWRAVIAEHPELCTWVAHNKQVPAEILAELARSPDADVRVVVAMKRKLDCQSFELLAADADERVRCRVGLNPNVPADIRDQLADDPDTWVRRTIREHPGRTAP